MPAINISKLGRHIADIGAQLKLGLEELRKNGVQAQAPDFIDINVTVLVANGAGAITRKTVVDAVTEETITTGEMDVTTEKQEKVNSGGTESETLFYYEADE